MRRLSGLNKDDKEFIEVTIHRGIAKIQNAFFKEGLDDYSHIFIDDICELTINDLEDFDFDMNIDQDERFTRQIIIGSAQAFAIKAYENLVEDVKQRGKEYINKISNNNDKKKQLLKTINDDNIEELLFSVLSKRKPTDEDIKKYIDKKAEKIIKKTDDSQNNATEIIEEELIDETSETQNVDEDTETQNTENETTEKEDVQNDKNKQVFKEYDITFGLENYEEVQEQIKNLKEIIDIYNDENGTSISINVINNDVHATLNRGMVKISRLKRLCSKNIWSLLKELNFDFDWINKNQENGVLATFFEGEITQKGIVPNNTMHFIIYYDGGITFNTTASRMRKIAEEILLLPQSNCYYAITNDALNSPVDSNANSVENACSGIKQFSDFTSAETWLLNEKSNIVMREGVGIPDDNNIWKNYNEQVYSMMYEQFGVPTETIETYNFTISVTDNKDSNKILKQWLDNNKGILTEV